MTGSTRRLIIAVLAWPAGLVAAVVWLVVSTPSTSCPSGSVCSIQAQPLTIEHTVKLAALLLGPGIFATVHWWRGRREPDAQ